MEWLIAGASVSTIRNMWCAIEDGHRMFGHRPPFWEPGAFRRRLKALSSIRGSPTKLAFPIGVHHVSGHATPSLVSARCSGTTSCWLHAEVSSGTAICAHPCEVPSVQACNVRWGVDAAFHVQYEDGVGMRVKKRKNHTARHGLLTRVPASHLQRMMMTYSQGKAPTCQSSLHQARLAGRSLSVLSAVSFRRSCFGRVRSHRDAPTGPMRGQP